jgi:hypothetical protein
MTYRLVEQMVFDDVVQSYGTIIFTKSVGGYLLVEFDSDFGEIERRMINKEDIKVLVDYLKRTFDL